MAGPLHPHISYFGVFFARLCDHLLKSILTYVHVKTGLILAFEMSAFLRGRDRERVLNVFSTCFQRVLNVNFPVMLFLHNFNKKELKQNISFFFNYAKPIL